ncbi:Ulp1 protease family, C-terminal catalytic domain [Sesbania bispinosa]|nr:Ulp1 protease family, C-terminal catalytic domain [Sesbania bispinosa]
MAKTPAHKRGPKTKKNESAEKSRKTVLRRSRRLTANPASQLGTRTRSCMSKKTSKEIIEISSSNAHSALNDFMKETDSDSPISANTPHKDDTENGSQSPIAEQREPNVSQRRGKEVDLEEKVNRLGTSVEQLTIVVHGLSAIFSNNTVVQSSPNSVGIPFIINNFKPPIIGSPNSKKQTVPLQATETPLTNKNTLTSNKSNNNKTYEKQKEQNYGSASKNLFSRAKEDSNTVYYMNLDPLHSAKYVGRTKGIRVPWWMPLMFRPPSDMVLDEIEAAVAAFIFGLKYEEDLKDEYAILVTSKLGVFGERCRIKSLMPRQEMHQDVLNLVVAMLTEHARATCPYSICWFLPIEFSRYCLAWMKPPTASKNSYKDDYMGKIDFLSKMFIPMNDENKHWYLLVADIKAKKLVLLDSAPCEARKEARQLQAKKMAVYLEEMFQDESFYDFSVTNKPRVTEFPLLIPSDIGRQAAGSNDCGVWVSKWMTNCSLNDDYNIKVDRETRMRLAIDLIIKPYNLKKEEVVSLAVNDWNKMHEDRKA